MQSLKTSKGKSRNKHGRNGKGWRQYQRQPVGWRTIEVPGEDTPDGTAISKDVNKEVLGSTSGGQETEGEYDRDID